jgi:hypothetical protein
LINDKNDENYEYHQKIWSVVGLTAIGVGFLLSAIPVAPVAAVTAAAAAPKVG